VLDSPYFVSEKSTKPLLASVAPERKAPLRPHSPRPRTAHAAERPFGCRKRGGRLYRDISNNSRPITPKIVGYQQKKNTIRPEKQSASLAENKKTTKFVYEKYTAESQKSYQSQLLAESESRRSALYSSTPSE